MAFERFKSALQTFRDMASIDPDNMGRIDTPANKVPPPTPISEEMALIRRSPTTEQLVDKFRHHFAYHSNAPMSQGNIGYLHDLARRATIDTLQHDQKLALLFASNPEEFYKSADYVKCWNAYVRGAVRASMGEDHIGAFMQNLAADERFSPAKLADPKHTQAIEITRAAEQNPTRNAPVAAVKAEKPKGKSWLERWRDRRAARSLEADTNFLDEHVNPLTAAGDGPAHGPESPEWVDSNLPHDAATPHTAPAAAPKPLIEAEATATATKVEAAVEAAASHKPNWLNRIGKGKVAAGSIGALGAVGVGVWAWKEYVAKPDVLPQQQSK